MSPKQSPSRQSAGPRLWGGWALLREGHALGFPRNRFCVLQLDQICISFDEGKTTMNFVEAALLIQGSACVYSKKVGAPGHGTGYLRG